MSIDSMFRLNAAKNILITKKLIYFDLNLGFVLVWTRVQEQDYCNLSQLRGQEKVEEGPQTPRVQRTLTVQQQHQAWRLLVLQMN